MSRAKSVIRAMLIGIGAVGAGGATDAAAQQRVLFPSYIYPGSNSVWTTFAADAATRACVSTMIINPNSGVGATRDAAYGKATRDMQAVGISILGYISTRYGARPLAEIRAEIDAYRQWYQVNGIFLDETTTEAGLVDHYAAVAMHIRSVPNARVVLNPGVFPKDRRYVEMADSTVVFESTYAAYVGNWNPPAWAASFPPEKFAHIVHTTPNAAALTTALGLSRERRAGHIYITDGVQPNPYNHLPTFWPETLRTLGCATR